MRRIDPQEFPSKFPGNVVLWKPSDAAMLASYAVYQVLLEAGLPPNVIQFVPADGPVFGDAVTSSEHLCGLNFTGRTFKRLWKQVAENLDRYRNFPRLAGECGGKNFHLVHSSADVASVVNGTLRSAFEYGGQKCSACSRLYAPDSLWPQIKEKLLEEHGKIKVGDPAQDFGTFFSAVIDDKVSAVSCLCWGAAPSWSMIMGRRCVPLAAALGARGRALTPPHPQEIFGPILTVFVYPEKRFQDVLELVDTTTPYGLTGAVFAREKSAIEEARRRLRNAAGNFYINDKSTGAVVAQQPFGGSRVSGERGKTPHGRGERPPRPPPRAPGGRLHAGGPAPAAGALLSWNRMQPLNHGHQEARGSVGRQRREERGSERALS
ncbi:PREDICTED: delta-1-pyrroline-5-carboxylate dehydrogenase, mitochondrial [Tinamus guttatus]|uniref:delta-1-pyrroline-5-carboxylate dehydrogenase, mitochondrial n=1 Tax=Tinamus guttatus TaxID=94827 RepID=UPI00052E92DD|nr:PREDICTED: delta-1-pyrroline-5-carboxylate dehydrogenase, mitochondrial [Tinamus guttatus]